MLIICDVERKPIMPLSLSPLKNSNENRINEYTIVYKNVGIPRLFGFFINTIKRQKNA